MLRLNTAFTFPDPRDWPAEAVEYFRHITEPRFLMDMFAFRQTDQTGVFYFEDAISAGQVLPIRRDEWSIEAGYPSFTFDWWKLSGYTQKLHAAGYHVVIMEKAAQGDKKSGKVVTITSARNVLTRGHQKWA